MSFLSMSRRWTRATVVTITAAIAACVGDPSSPHGAGSPSFAKGGSSSGSSVTITSASPDSGQQGTTLDVHVFGNGYANGMVARWELGGVQDSTQVKTNSTTFVSSKELVANITISNTAAATSWSVAVFASADKTGVGSELGILQNAFSVTYPGRIVYVNNGLHVYNLTTGVDVNLNTSGVNPKFSPDGSTIVFENSQTGIWVMNADGSNQRNIVPGSNVGMPNFDPTGTTVAFGNSLGIATVPTAGGAVTQLTTDGASDPVYSPDGTQIATRGTGSLVIMNADGTNPRAITAITSIIDLCWQPSNKIAFVKQSKTLGGIYTYDPSTGVARQLTTSGFYPSWSPDATHLSFTYTGGKTNTNGIWIMNADGTGQQGGITGATQGAWGPP